MKRCRCFIGQTLSRLQHLGNCRNQRLQLKRLEHQTGTWGNSGDDGPATEAKLAGVAGIALMPEPGGRLTIFIADYYNGQVRAVGPDGIMRNVSDEGRLVLGAPTRLAFAPRRRWLYVADSSLDKIAVLIIPNLTPNLVPPQPLVVPMPARKGG